MATNVLLHKLPSGSTYDTPCETGVGRKNELRPLRPFFYLSCPSGKKESHSTQIIAINIDKGNRCVCYNSLFFYHPSAIKQGEMVVSGRSSGIVDGVQFTGVQCGEYTASQLLQHLERHHVQFTLSA